MTEDEIILTHILKCRAIDLAVNKPALTPFQQEIYNNYRERRASGEPLQYILGACNFMGLELAVNPSVLIPRPETEQLVDAAVGHLKQKQKGTVLFWGTPLRVLDLGTGSANIAIALAGFVPESQIVSIDASQPALKLALINAEVHGVERKINFVLADMLAYLSEARDFPGETDEQKFDMVISNPPYIPADQIKTLPKDVQQEPAMALDGGEDGLKFIRNIIKYTPYLLRQGGCLMMEFGDGQTESIQQMAGTEKAFSSVEILRDLAGRERILKAII